MAGRVRVVTDSTAFLDADTAAELAIEVVPLQVIIDGTPHVEGAEIGPAAVADALRRHAQVSTSRPSPQAFLERYTALADRGASHVVSIHLSGSLSGTADAARLAAQESPVPVEVVDSRSVGMGLGFAVLAAADSARRGEPVDQVIAAAVDRATWSSAFFYVDTLDYLRRGGRIGAASAMVGTALSIKPLLHLVDGTIKPMEKVRTSARAVARLEDLAVECAGESAVDIAVHYLGNADRAQALATRLEGRVPDLRRLVVTEVGAVIGAHAGPGMLAVVVSPLSR